MLGVVPVSQASGSYVLGVAVMACKVAHCTVVGMRAVEDVGVQQLATRGLPHHSSRLRVSYNKGHTILQSGW